MLKSIVLNYPNRSRTILDHSNEVALKSCYEPYSAESVKELSDLLWSFLLLKKDYHLEMKIRPGDDSDANDEYLFQIIDGFYKRNRKLMSIARRMAEKKIFPESIALEKLSIMQKKVLKLVQKGFPYLVIAKILNLSPHTVNGHRKNAMRILGVKNMASLVTYLDKFSFD